MRLQPVQSGDGIAQDTISLSMVTLATMMVNIRITITPNGAETTEDPLALPAPPGGPPAPSHTVLSTILMSKQSTTIETSKTVLEPTPYDRRLATATPSLASTPLTSALVEA